MRSFARLLILAALLTLAWCTLRWAPVAAQDAITPVLALARLCVNEAGLGAYRRADCAAIDAVIRFRQEFLPAHRGDSYLETLHRCSRRAVIERGHRGRPWIVDLWPDGREPARYCRTCRWEGRGARAWARTYRHAVAIRQGDIVPRCSPHAWARPDVRPADPTAVVADCGATANTFWIIPAYVERWGIGDAS